MKCSAITKNFTAVATAKDGGPRQRWDCHTALPGVICLMPVHARTVSIKVRVVLSVLCLWSVTVRADERLLVDARVSGKPGRFAFDSGAADMIIFPDAAGRLGLRLLPVTNSPA